MNRLLARLLGKGAAAAVRGQHPSETDVQMMRRALDLAKEAAAMGAPCCKMFLAAATGGRP